MQDKLKSQAVNQMKDKHTFVPRLDFTALPLPPEEPRLHDNDTTIPIEGFALDQNIAYASFPTPKPSLPH